MQPPVHISLVNHSFHSATHTEQRHPVNELIYALSPGYGLQVARRRIALEPGQVLVIGRDVAHCPSVRPDRQTSVYVLQWTQRRPVFDGALGPLVDADARILVLLRWLEELATRPASAERTQRMVHVLTPILDQIESLERDEAITFSDRVLEALRVDHGHALTVHDLADNFGLSAAHLARRFKAETGVTVGQALTRIRVQHALSLVSGSDLSLSAIAARVGIGSVAHLCRLIKRHTGRTASQLRAGRRADPQGPM